MSNANLTAFPSPKGATRGLTKREYFAALALQGLCADTTSVAIPQKLIARSAVDLADALIAELEKQP